MTRYFEKLIAMVALCGISCARPLPPPLAFVDSEAFAAAEGRAYGRLQGDLDADGVAETVLLERLEFETGGRPEGSVGYEVRIYRRELADERWVWKAQCETAPVAGEDLDTVRWIDMGGERLLLVMASESNPDRVRQSFALVQPGDCELLASDTVVLRRPGYEVIAPQPVPGGVFYDDDVGIRIVDEPRVLRLGGTDGEVELLVGVRERRLTRRDGQLESVQGTRTFLRPLAVRARWLPRGDLPSVSVSAAVTHPEQALETQRPDAIAGAVHTLVIGPSDLPELGDVDEATAFAIRGGEGGTLELNSSAPIALLEIRHGCVGETSVPLALSDGDTAYITGTKPPRGAFVRAAGRSHALNGAQRDLLALAVGTASLRLFVAADPVARCVRDVRAFGFGSPGADLVGRASH